MAPIWVKKLPKKEAEEVAMKNLTRVQIDDQALKFPGQLSGGQRQSINLARSILHKPSLLILDEPTSSMDTATEKIVLDNLSSWMKDKTLIAITHRNTLVKLASRVMVIDRGLLVADDTPEKLMQANNK